MIGTQRDVSRLTRRGVEFSVTPLKEYNDLYQYVAVTATDPVKNYYAQEFVEYLLSDSVQKKLNEIYMFSPYVPVEYDIEHYDDLQSIAFSSTVSAFISPEELIRMQELSIDALNGNKAALNKIKNMLV